MNKWIMNDNLMEYLLKNEEPYELKIGDMVVEMQYSENNKSFKECMRNILRLKANKIVK